MIEQRSTPTGTIISVSLTTPPIPQKYGLANVNSGFNPIQSLSARKTTHDARKLSYGADQQRNTPGSKPVVRDPGEARNRDSPAITRFPPPPFPPPTYCSDVGPINYRFLNNRHCSYCRPIQARGSRTFYIDDSLLVGSVGRWSTLAQQ